VKVLAEPLGGRVADLLEEQVQHEVVDAPVFLDLLKTEKAGLCSVLGERACDALRVLEVERVNTQGGKNVCNTVWKPCQSVTRPAAIAVAFFLCRTNAFARTG